MTPKPHENNHHHPQLPGTAEGRDHENESSGSVVERHAEHRRVGAPKKEKSHTPGIVIRVTRVGRRLIDWDNLCAKPLVDGLRYAGLIPDDRPSIAKIEVDQRKAGPGEDEHAEVEITYPEIL